MLTIDNLIWVCPGLAGMWAYNSVLVVKLPQGEGWKYLSLIVFFALPYYLIKKIFPSESEYYAGLIMLVSYILLGIVIAWVGGDKGKEYKLKLIIFPLISVALFSIPLLILRESVNKDVMDLLISIPISAVFGWITGLIRNDIIKNKAITFDPFHDGCTSWKNKLVFITLKNNKVYLGVLMDHTKVAGFVYTIRIIPAYSGYRDEVGDLHWKDKYPPQSNAFVQTIVPQSEIVAFTLWNDSEEFENRPSQVLKEPPPQQYKNADE